MQLHGFGVSPARETPKMGGKVLFKNTSPINYASLELEREAEEILFSHKKILNFVKCNNYCYMLYYPSDFLLYCQI